MLERILRPVVRRLSLFVVVCGVLAATCVEVAAAQGAGDACAAGTRACANKWELTFQADLARSSWRSRQGANIDVLGRVGSRGVLGGGLGLSRCVGDRCPDDPPRDLSLRAFAAYELTANPGFGAYIAPTAYFKTQDRQGLFLGTQLGLNAHTHPFGWRPIGFGVRLYMEPRIPIASSKAPVDVLFGVGIFVSLGRKYSPLPVEKVSVDDENSLPKALTRLVTKEVSDVALGDPSPEECHLVVNSSEDAPFEDPSSTRCLDELTRAVEADTCVSFVAVGAASINARLLVRKDGPVLVEDLTASTWPVVTYCNSGSAAVEVDLKLWAPSADDTADVLVSRFDFEIPWGRLAATPEDISKGHLLTLVAGTCQLVQFAHGSERIELKADPTRVARVVVKAPWYMDLSIKADKTATSAAFSFPTEPVEIVWTSMTEVSGAPFDKGGVYAESHTGGPVMFCSTAK